MALTANDDAFSALTLMRFMLVLPEPGQGGPPDPDKAWAALKHLNNAVRKKIQTGLLDSEMAEAWEKRFGTPPTLPENTP